MVGSAECWMMVAKHDWKEFSHARRSGEVGGLFGEPVGYPQILITNVQHDQMHVDVFQERRFHRIDKSSVKIFSSNVLLSE